MERIHQRQVLKKNCRAYYRVLENIMNHSSKKVKMLNLIEPLKHFKIDGSENVCWEDLYTYNESQNLPIIDDGAQSDDDEN